MQRWRLMPGEYHVTGKLGLAYFADCEATPERITPAEPRQTLLIGPTRLPGFFAVVQHPSGKGEPGWMPGPLPDKPKKRRKVRA